MEKEWKTVQGKFNGTGGAEVVSFGPGILKGPKSGHVLIDAEASAICASDLMFSRGVIPKNKHTFVPGYDVVGRVIAVGAGGDSSWLGRRVLALVITGGQSTLVQARLDQLVVVPESLDRVKAAALGLNYATALGLFQHVGTGEVFYPGLTGGVGSALTDLSPRFPGITLVGSVSPGTRPRDPGILIWEYTDPHLMDRVREQFPTGMDIVIDPFGGRHGRYFDALLKPRTGRRIGIGYGGRTLAGFLVNQVASQWGGPGRGFFSIALLSITDPLAYRRILKDLGILLSKGNLDPIIAGIFPLENLAQAYELFERKGTVGKVVVTMGG